MDELSLLLDDRRLNGVHGIRRLLGPERVVALVDASDVGDARRAVEQLCLNCGGSTSFCYERRRLTGGA